MTPRHVETKKQGSLCVSDQIHVLGCGNMDPSSVAVGFGGTPSLVRMLWYMCEGLNAYIRHHDLTAL